nr:unnamed protein product [Callosobruchus chinensis]
MASGRQSTLNLPINVNLETILSFLSSLKGVGSSPLIYFSAALLGYTSKGNSGQCTQTFPNCPSDPDKLVQFFNGLNPSIGLINQNSRRAKDTSYSYASLHKRHLKTTAAEKRIQTRPTVYIPLNSDLKDEETVSNFDDPRKYRGPKGLKFPPEEVNLHHTEPTETLRFPKDYEVYEYAHENSYRRPKELYHDLSYNQNSLNLQRPLPNHRPTTMIFPIRTGTGELKLDPEELDVQNDSIYVDEHKEQTRIKFQSEQEDSSKENEKYRDGNSIFTFPS